MKRAFTLIELLVVIAIIAILAAILFPVFAQAKSSAKDAAILSNLKQMALANLMYCSDNDDVFPLSAQLDGNGNFTVWQESVMPYVKTQELRLDTKLPRPYNNPGDPDSAGKNFYTRNSHFGMTTRGPAANGAGGYTAPSAGNPGTWAFGLSLRTNRTTGGEYRLCDGILGAAVDPIYAGGFYNYATASSLSQTSIDQVATMYMVGQSGNWDMWWGVIGRPMYYFVRWIPEDYNVKPNYWAWSGPHARKNPRNAISDGMPPVASLPPAGAPVDANGVPNGLCIYATADGSAHTSDVRGDVYAGVGNVSGFKVCKRLWPYASN